MELTVIEIAELIAAAGVIGGLVFVAIQIRHNTESVRMQTFQTIIDRVAAINSRTCEPAVAEIVARGRKSYSNLSDAEKITFNYYMHERILMYESCLQFERFLRPEIRDVVHENIRYHFGFPGVKEWWTHGDRESIAQDAEDEIDRIVIG